MIHDFKCQGKVEDAVMWLVRCLLGTKLKIIQFTITRWAIGAYPVLTPSFHKLSLGCYANIVWKWTRAHCFVFFLLWFIVTWQEQRIAFIFTLKSFKFNLYLVTAVCGIWILFNYSNKTEIKYKFWHKRANLNKT